MNGINLLYNKFNLRKMSHVLRSHVTNITIIFLRKRPPNIKF